MIDARDIVTYMTVDLTAQNNFDYVRAIQGDNSSRYVYVEVLKNQQPYIKDESDIDGIAAILMGTKPDGKTIFNMCDIVLENDVWYVAINLTTAITECPGKSSYAVAFFNTFKSTKGEITGKKLESFPFNIYIAQSAFDTTEMSSSSEWDVITDVIAHVDEIKALHKETKEFSDSAFISETNAKTSEENAAESAEAAFLSIDLSKSWAVGGTGKREGEQTNNSSYYSKQASQSANQSKSSASASLQSSQDSAQSANESAVSAQNSLDSSKTSESWAIGGTHTRSDEDTNNSKYWSEQSSIYAANSKKSASDAEGYLEALIAAAEKGLLRSKGIYVPDVKYTTLDMITYNGSSFVVLKADTIGVTPDKEIPYPNAEHPDYPYQLLARGADDASELTQEEEPRPYQQVAGGFWLKPYN